MEQMMVDAVIPWGNGSADYESTYSDLAAAIVAQAAKDYIKVLRTLWKKNSTIQVKRKLILEKMELESFFHSAWYETLTDLKPDWLLSKCRDAALEQEKKQRQRQRQKRATARQNDGRENPNETGQSIT